MWVDGRDISDFDYFNCRNVCCLGVVDWGKMMVSTKGVPTHIIAVI